MKYTMKPYKRRFKPHRRAKAYSFVSPKIVVSENKAIIRVLGSEDPKRPRACAASSILQNRK